ncbi:UNVERIFIED_CONTAM: hypothetical protein K2H54_068161 [Gekko kuhli]
MLSAASQLSFRGALETVLTWTGSKSGALPPKEKAWQNGRDVFSVVVTPDRIPKFCIPSLEVDHLAVHTEPVEEAQETPLGEHHTWSSAPETQNKKEPVRVSPPPYGFLTLGESPNIRRKESLFFGRKSTELRVLLAQKKENACPSRHPASPLTVHRQSWKWGDHSTKNLRPTPQDQLFNKPAPASLHCTPSPERATNAREKKRFQLMMRKHLPIIRKFRSNSAPADRLVALAERSMNSPVS